MKPITPRQDFAGRMGTFMENVNIGVKNIYELPVQEAFRRIDTSNVDSRVKEAAKVGVGIAAAIPQSVSETMLAPGRIAGHAVEGKLSQQDVTTVESFILGVALPSVVKGGGVALGGIAAKGLRYGGASAPSALKIGELVGKAPALAVGAGGVIYASSVLGRVQAEPTDIGKYRKTIEIGSTELVPMTFGGAVAPKFSKIELPTAARIEAAKLQAEGKPVPEISQQQAQSITAWQGIATEGGKPLFGKTPEGWKFGTPSFKTSTVQEVYGASLASEIGYRPISPLEVRLAKKSIIEKYPELEQRIALESLQLRGMTFGTKSAFTTKELPLKEPLERHELKPETIKNIEAWIKGQKDIVVGGSTAQKAQMKGMTREVHDIDIYVKDRAKATQELLGIIEKTEPKGKVTPKSKTPGGEMTSLRTKKGTIFDIHDIKPTAVSEYGLSIESPKANLLKFGFTKEPQVKIGGIKAQALSEQATAKMASTISLRKGGVGPTEWRYKDIGDYLKIEPELIESQQSGLFSGLRTGKIAREKRLSKQLSEDWITKMMSATKEQQKDFWEAYKSPSKEVLFVSESLKPKRTAVKSVKESTEQIVRGVGRAGAGTALTPQEVVKKYFPEEKVSRKLTKHAEVSQPSRVSRPSKLSQDLLRLDIPSKVSRPSKPSETSKTSKVSKPSKPSKPPRPFLSLDIPSRPSKPSKPGRPYDFTSYTTPSQPSKPSEPSEPSKPPKSPDYPSTPSEPSYTPPPYTPPSYTPPERPPVIIPPIFGWGGLAGGTDYKFQLTDKELRIHKIPSPAELMSFGNIKKSKVKGKSLLELDI